MTIQMNSTIDFYNSQSTKIFQQYQSLSFENVHGSWLKKVNLHQHKTALDIGAGSGRDALALSHFGLTVTAIEPAQSLKSKAVELTGDKVCWLSDTLPELSSLTHNTFDVILVSAVWMHLTPKEQNQSLKRITALLNFGGVAIITLRHGSFKDDRKSFEVSSARLTNDAKEIGLKLFLHDKGADKLNRSDIYWETIVFKN